MTKYIKGATFRERNFTSAMAQEACHVQGNDPCRAQYELLCCTRPAGHDGLHVAAGTEDVVLAVWEEYEQ